MTKVCLGTLNPGDAAAAEIDEWPVEILARRAGGTTDI